MHDFLVKFFFFFLQISIKRGKWNLKVVLEVLVLPVVLFHFHHQLDLQLDILNFLKNTSSKHYLNNKISSHKENTENWSTYVPYGVPGEVKQVAVQSELSDCKGTFFKGGMALKVLKKD
jgi:hypothetical protein